MTSPKSAVKEKMKYSKTAGSASIGSASSEKGKPISHRAFYDFEQLSPVGGGVHGNKYVGQAVYGFHVAACRYPYHSANGCVIAPVTRFTLSLLISPDGSIIPLSKSTFFMSSSYNLWCQNGARSYKIILCGDTAR